VGEVGRTPDRTLGGSNLPLPHDAEPNLCVLIEANARRRLYRSEDAGATWHS